MNMKTQQALKQYFGYDSFRGGQEELIEAVLAGHDALGIMPTGAGKSMCFQLPALMLEGITLIVSPLVSLMKDQVGALIQAGVAAAYLNATLTPRQMELALSNARYGKYKLIYVAPERLLVPDFLDFARNAQIAMVTVDEAHCISQWGQDFRPSYTQIPTFLAELPCRPVVSAFTATATTQVQTDIVRLLELREPKVLVTGFDRENLYFEVQTPKNKMEALTQFLHENAAASGIIYCATRKTVEAVCTELNGNGFSASRYHAGLPDAERHQNQDDFLYDRVQIMVATNAFGMGIDKSNVSFVVHYNMPKDLESYYQEAGRAGRDGSAARCLLLYSGQDVRTAQWMIENANDTEYPDAQTERLLKKRDYQRLREMTFYSTTNDCSRAYILRYFGETPPAYCGNCGNCDTKFELVDVTQDAQKILSCVHRMQGRFGVTMVLDVLRGSKNERIAQFGLGTLPNYGVSEKSVHTLRAVVEQLVAEHYLVKSDGQYPVLGLGDRADEILGEGKTLQMKLAQEKQPHEAASGAKNTADVAPARRALYERLRALRAALAKEQGVPAYVVFTDRSLVDMCARLPQSAAQFTNVQGVGETKRKRYGDVFLQEIAEFCRENVSELPNEASEGEPDEQKATVPRKAGAKKAALSAVLPGADVIKQIATSEEPAPVRELSVRMNEVLKAHGCMLVTAQKLTGWLVGQGYLEVVESAAGEGAKNKRPTARGTQAGITQEERAVRGNTYQINLYPQSVQQLLLAHLGDIVSFVPEKRAEGGEL